MKYSADIDKDGNFNLPEEVRTFLDVMPGRDSIVFDIVDGEILVAKQ